MLHYTAVATGLASHTVFSIIIDFLIKKCKYVCATMKYAINRDSKGHVFLFLDTYDVNLFFLELIAVDFHFYIR